MLRAATSRGRWSSRCQHEGASYLRCQRCTQVEHMVVQVCTGITTVCSSYRRVTFNSREELKGRKTICVTVCCDSPCKLLSVVDKCAYAASREAA